MGHGARGMWGVPSLSPSSRQCPVRRRLRVAARALNALSAVADRSVRHNRRVPPG